MSSKWGVGGRRWEGGSRGRRGTSGRVYVLKEEREKWRASWWKRTDVMNLQTGGGKKKKKTAAEVTAEFRPRKHAANELICCIPPFFFLLPFSETKKLEEAGERERERKNSRGLIIHTDRDVKAMS